MYLVGDGDGAEMGLVTVHGQDSPFVDDPTDGGLGDIVESMTESLSRQHTGVKPWESKEIV